MSYGIKVENKLTFGAAAEKVRRVHNLQTYDIPAGAPVIWDSTNSTAQDLCVQASATGDDASIAGVTIQYIAAGAYGEIQVDGPTRSVNARVDGTTAIAVGDFLSNLGTADYTTGTATFTNASTAVTGSGTTWTAAMVGRYIYDTGDTRATAYLITARASNTSITISPAYIEATSAGATYTIKALAAQKATTGKAGVFAKSLAAYSTADTNGTVAAIVVPSGRQDASATVTYGTAGQMAAAGLDSANAAGTTAAVSRVDHVHTRTADTPALVFGISNVAGSAGKVLAADATIAVFDATVPTTGLPGAAAAVGTAAVAARRDHVHAFNASGAPADGSLAAANAAGTATNFSASDHNHKAILQNNVSLIFGTTNAAATAANVRYDTSDTVNTLKIGIDETSLRAIIMKYSALGTNTGLAAAANPELVIMDATTAKYVRFRSTTTTGIVDVPTGNSISFQVNSVEKFNMSATVLKATSGTTIDLMGAQAGWNTALRDVNANTLLQTYATAAAVNFLGIQNQATGSGVGLYALGTDASIDLLFNAKGASGRVGVATNGNGQSILKFLGAQASTNVNKIVDVNNNDVARLYAAANAVNFLSLYNSATTVPPKITSGLSGDVNVGFIIETLGTGSIQLQNAAANAVPAIADYNNATLLGWSNTASAVDYVQIMNGATGAPGFVQVAAVGQDANIDLRLASKGTGVVDVRYASVALGAGGSATLGTVGGSGPAATAQNAWLAVKVNGTVSYFPFWR